jgi:hypothetical protein
MRLFVDGAEKRTPGSGTPNTATAQALNFGRRSHGGNRFVGELAEALVFTYALPADARGSLEKYLAKRYGIQLAW